MYLRKNLLFLWTFFRKFANFANVISQKLASLRKKAIASFIEVSIETHFVVSSDVWSFSPSCKMIFTPSRTPKGIGPRHWSSTQPKPRVIMFFHLWENTRNDSSKKVTSLIAKRQNIHISPFNSCHCILPLLPPCLLHDSDLHCLWSTQKMSISRIWEKTGYGRTEGCTRILKMPICRNFLPPLQPTSIHVCVMKEKEGLR